MNKNRSDIVNVLDHGAIGVELGVARGDFSEKLLETGRFGHLYSIDMWTGDRNHDVAEYKTALRKLLPYRGINTVLRMRFDEALDLFPDEYFDFIYIDGYAHTGEENGKTLTDWWPKLKIGGYFAGDDYSSKWPLVVQVVDAFMQQKLLSMTIVDYENKGGLSKQPSWLTRKVTR